MEKQIQSPEMHGSRTLYFGPLILTEYIPHSLGHTSGVTCHLQLKAPPYPSLVYLTCSGPVPFLGL